MKSERATDAPLVSIMGTVSVWTPQGAQPVPARLDRAVLVHLTLAEGRALPVDSLIDALWPDGPPANARNALQVKISRLRAQLGVNAARLEYAQGSYRLRLRPEQTDIGCFAALVARGDAAMRHGDSAGAQALLGRALDMWAGEPFAEFGHQPRIVAARSRLTELWQTAREAHAEARLDDPADREAAIADLRGLLEQTPLRPRARRALMHGLDLSGHRAEALAVYDAGRRLFTQISGLEPPAELRETFERLLDAERRATRRAAVLQRMPRSAPDGLVETARWLADDGDLTVGLQLAVRGAWWWWIGGERGRGRELLEDLLERSGDDGSVDGAARLSAQSWLGVFDSVTARAAVSLSAAERALRSVRRPPWRRHDALAAALIAERLFERGEHVPADRLLQLATRHYAVTGDDWGQALCDTVAARGGLLSGDITRAESAARATLADFCELGDSAGQIMSLDILGYCAEVRGNLSVAHEIHQRALELSRRTGSPDWEATQLTRLGNVGVLAGWRRAVDDLTQAAALSADICSDAITALSRNGLGLALQLRGDVAAATDAHLAAWTWYTETKSHSGQAYTGARIALVHANDVAVATRWATDSLRLAVDTKDPRAVAHSLEALALVNENAADATNALAAAAALRAATKAKLPPTQQRPLDVRKNELAGTLGSRFDDVWRSGAQDPAGVARNSAFTGSEA